jgi:hypothetical protein
MNFPTSSAVAAVALLALAACGGAAAPSTGTAAPATSPVGTSTTAPATTSAPATTPAVATTAPAGTAGAIDLCALLTKEDVNAVIPGGSTEGTLTKPVGGYCYWENATTGERVITAIEPRTLDAIKASATACVDITVGGHAGCSLRDEASHVQTTFIDIGAQSLIVEIPTSSDPAADLTNAQALAEIAVGNL